MNKLDSKEYKSKE